jgi:hypothetical protein
LVEKLKPLNMSFDEALTRLAKVPKSKGKDKVAETKKLPNNKNKGTGASPSPLVKKT